MADLGFRLAASPAAAFAAMYKAVRQSYQCLAQGRIDPFLGRHGVAGQMKAVKITAGFDQLL
ncbi:MAG: hypothetical protein Q8P24_04365 [Desulfobacterales bacterium]|nr:hypothetical protein [Desulfobacterales bacterium]